MKKLDTICRLKKSEGILTNKNGSVKILGGFKMAGAIMDKIWGVIGMNNNNQSRKWQNMPEWQFQQYPRS